MNAVERALELTRDATVLGLGSGRAAARFVKGLGARLTASKERVRGVATSEETARLAREAGIELVSLADVEALDATVDGADEVDPHLDLLKGWGRALVREKVVASASRRLIIIAGEEKLVPALGHRGKLPIEVLPFALAFCERRLRALGLDPRADRRDGKLFVTDNGNHILDCGTGPIADPRRLEDDIHSIPGIVGTGLFLGMADVVLIGKGDGMELADEKRRTPGRKT